MSLTTIGCITNIRYLVSPVVSVPGLSAVELCVRYSGTPTGLQGRKLGWYLRHLGALNWEALGSGLTSFGGLQPATETLLTILA